MSRFLNLHLPDEVRVFDVPEEAVRVWDDETLVFDVLIEDRVLRHFSFYDRWFEINCSLGRDGTFIVEPGPIDWTFNCDVCSPLHSQGDTFYSVDLFVDLLVSPDGRSYHLKDENELHNASGSGLIDATEVEGALNGVRNLRSLIESRMFLQFLDDILPFTNVNPHPQDPMTILSLQEVPQFERPGRVQTYGTRM